MEDRSVQYPQRYQLKKVEGTDDIYDLVPAPGTITAEGTLINKSALLKDETVALFKDLPENPVPDEVFRILSNAALVDENGELNTPDGTAVPGIKVVTGEYTGTGKYGKNNPVVLEFDDQPVFVFIQNKNMSGHSYFFLPLTYCTKATAYSGTWSSRIVDSVSFNKTLSFYSASEDYAQMNETGVKYSYVAFLKG